MFVCIQFGLLNECTQVGETHYGDCLVVSCFKTARIWVLKLVQCFSNVKGQPSADHIQWSQECLQTFITTFKSSLWLGTRLWRSSALLKGTILMQKGGFEQETCRRRVLSVFRQPWLVIDLTCDVPKWFSFERYMHQPKKGFWEISECVKACCRFLLINTTLVQHLFHCNNILFLSHSKQNVIWCTRS